MNYAILRPKEQAGKSVLPLRRSGHGSTAFSTESTLRQPQDGSSVNSSGDVSERVVDIAVRRSEKMFAEPEDARLTGGTRSLMRRMFGLNIAARAVAKVSPSLQLKPAKAPLTA